MEMHTLLELFIWLWGTVVTFFSYKILAISKQINQLHEVYTKTDESGMYLGYSDSTVIAHLKEHINNSREEDNRFNQRLNGIELKLEKLDSEILRCCKFFADNPKR